ncbi:kinase-like domain-containing protein [Elsinoe ampelina]|uniref:Kinase-like domain-containing protein n=1 Tax=Elsinoe ampelina TaxID=302913 RepID=A0A6A6FYD4_9PEZI|nr:kinase-like domain-containing protein [Elsinoe ampelina]
MDFASTERSSASAVRVDLTFTHVVSGRTAAISVNLADDLMLGRADVEEHLGLEEPTISKAHVRLHCIVYEQEKSSISPMLYVKSISRNTTALSKKGPGGTRSIKLYRNSAPNLIEHGDTLALSPTVHLQITFPNFTTPSLVLNALQRQEAEAFDDHYLISKSALGHGGYGAVYMAYEKKSDRQVACKIVDLHHVSRMACEEAVNESDRNYKPMHFSEAAQWSAIKTRWQKRLMKKLDQGYAELAILKDLSHPNIVGAESIFMSEHTIYIFQELITGGDLWSYLDTYGRPGLQDADATVIIKQLVEAVHYLHSHDIVHRDIKPENILMNAWEPGGRVVLTDFGLAKRTAADRHTELARTHRQRMHTAVGTAGYAAPEVQLDNNGDLLETGYTCAVDLWSVGAITALLFTSQSVQELFPVEEMDEIDLACLEDADSDEPIAGITMDTDGHYPFMATCSQRTAMPTTSQKHLSGAADSPNVVGTLVCNLSDLSNAQHDIWGRIASAPKDFIKRLLVLNEYKRMTARQALQHRWLAQPYYKDILERVYQKAISGWTPKEHAQVERVSAGDIKLAPMDDDSILLKMVRDSRSSYFR